MTTNLQQRRRIAGLAASQHGNVTRQQLLNLGLGGDAIAYRCRTGELYRLHRGVYAVGRPPAVPIEAAAAAVLACGASAALSHGSAMVLWEFWKRWPATVEVSVTLDRRPKGITVHHPRTLTRRDITTHRGIRATTAARTLLDMATRTARKTLTRAINNALNSPYLTESQLVDLLSRNPTHPGTRLLRPHVAESHHGLTRSELEETFREFGRTQNLPRFQTNVLVHGYVVDVYFEDEQLIVELDSWQFHKNRQAFETDRTRDVDALTHGIPTVRVTHERLTTDPGAEAARLLAILEQRRLLLSPTRAPQPGGARATRAVRPTRRRARDRPAR
jgi:very-short-patch-repair endonuclease